LGHASLLGVRGAPFPVQEALRQRRRRNRGPGGCGDAGPASTDELDTRGDAQRASTSLNGASVAVATIATVPAVALLSVATNREIVFGLEKRDTVLLLLTLLLSVVSFGAGRTNLMTGLVHLVVFATYIFLLFVP
jgi:hypothetical protein